jgi:hypothetical protein
LSCPPPASFSKRASYVLLPKEFPSQYQALSQAIDLPFYHCTFRGLHIANQTSQHPTSHNGKPVRRYIPHYLKSTPLTPSSRARHKAQHNQKTHPPPLNVLLLRPTRPNRNHKPTRPPHPRRSQRRRATPTRPARSTTPQRPKRSEYRAPKRPNPNH